MEKINYSKKLNRLLYYWWWRKRRCIYSIPSYEETNHWFNTQFTRTLPHGATSCRIHLLEVSMAMNQTIKEVAQWIHDELKESKLQGKEPDTPFLNTKVQHQC